MWRWLCHHLSNIYVCYSKLVCLLPLFPHFVFQSLFFLVLLCLCVCEREIETEREEESMCVCLCEFVSFVFCYDRSQGSLHFGLFESTSLSPNTGDNVFIDFNWTGSFLRSAENEKKIRIYRFKYTFPGSHPLWGIELSYLLFVKCCAHDPLDTHFSFGSGLNTQRLNDWICAAHMWTCYRNTRKSTVWLRRIDCVRTCGMILGMGSGYFIIILSPSG